MPRPHIFLTNTCVPSPTAKLDPRYHPLGQPGPKHRGPVWICKIPLGLRMPAMVLGYCFITWNVRRWLFPHRCRTIHNVELPMHTEREVEGVWYERFRKQTDVYRWGHIYAAMQEKRIREAKKRGILPENYPENEEQLNRMDRETFEAMMPKVRKLKFEVDKDRIDGVCALRQKLPASHGQVDY